MGVTSGGALAKISKIKIGKWDHLTLSLRHFPSNVTIPKSSGNTMLTISRKEAAADLAEIYQRGDKIRFGQTFKVSSGRVYKIHNNSIHPIGGPGTVNISSREYKILKLAKKSGFENAEKNMNIQIREGFLTQDEYDRTKELLKIMKAKGK